MASMNRVTLIGNVGRDPESRYTATNDKMVILAVATTESWKDKKTGEKVEKTEWHNVVLYRGVADIADKYLEKGSAVFIEGRLETKKYTDKNGMEKYSTQIIANDIKLLSPRPENGTGASRPKPQASSNRPSRFEESAEDLEIPF